ncbi:MAG TPA: 50S ribosomal protein L29 [Candidatus Saccharimonadales bacterium]|nr:50S ribosomal protein L29 [Candidatus Saccharimonadales bacterium]
MNIAEIRKLSTAELAVQSTKTREEITELKRRVHLGEIQNTRIIRNKRKDLARMLTVLSEALIKEAN